MHRGPWHPERLRESGGMEELQTDVMRFMAILAFCLVAIFALVRGIPTEPQQRPLLTEAAATRQAAALTPSGSSQGPVHPPAQTKTPTRSVAHVAPPAPAAPREAKRGYSLQFESDAVLRKLVEENTVALYARGKGQTWRLSARAGGLTFQPTASPGQLHLMSPDTVPARLLRALLQVTTEPTDDTTWGVTLPRSATEAINRHLSSPGGGALIIGADGRVRREVRDTP